MSWSEQYVAERKLISAALRIVSHDVYNEHSGPVSSDSAEAEYQSEMLLEAAQELVKAHQKAPL